MAEHLGVGGSADPVQSIIDYCVSKMGSWLRAGVSSITEVERVVCERMRLTIEQVWSDSELLELVTRHVCGGDPVFATLPESLDETTYAVLLRRRRVDGRSQDQRVAVIDCRGAKAQRRFFSRWHEIAHLLTLYDQLELPFHRSVIEKDPTERLMDLIAAEIGFYAPLFDPLVAAEVEGKGHLDFAGVESIRNCFCPEASFQATLIASARRSQSPALYIEAAIAYKKAEARALSEGQDYLLPSAKPRPKMRAVVSAPNGAARSMGLDVHRNMSVPENSLIARLFCASESETALVTLADQAIENLGTWTHSDGSTLADMETRVEARRIGDRVVALVTPV